MENQDTFILTQSSISDEDVKQEAALRELETGRKVSLRIIFNALASSDRVLYYGTYNHRQIEMAETPWSDNDKVNPQIVNSIIDWAVQQSPSKQTVIFNFLDLPIEEKEEALPSVLESLGLVDVTEVASKRPQKVHMSAIMRNSLPATKDELISLVQRLSPETKRPAAGVRQFLREHTRSKKIFLGNDGNYHLVD